MFRQDYFSATPPNILNLQCKDMRLQAKDIHLQSKDLYLQPKDKDFIAAFQNLYCLKCKHSKKCTFYTLRFGCSFAAVNTIKPQLL